MLKRLRNWADRLWCRLTFPKTVLTDRQIKRLIKNGTIFIDKYDPALVNPASLDVRLSKHFSKLKCTAYTIDPLDKESYSYESFEAPAVFLPPQGSIIASTEEVIGLPDWISYRLIGKSSLARLFIDNSSFGAWAEADFKGSLVLEIVNNSPYDIKLTAGMPIGQLVFQAHSRCETPYSKKKNSKYMNQRPATGSMYWKNV